MSGFNLGGIGSGIKKGVQYYYQFLRNLEWAFTHNPAALQDLMKIAAQNIKEFGGELTVSDNVLASLIFNPDFAHESRQMMHDFSAKYGDH